MNETLKVIFKSLLDRAIMASAAALISYGLITPSQTAGYDEIVTGIVMAIIGGLIGWYRDHGKALARAEIARLNAKVDALTKQAQQAAKLDGKAVAQATIQNIPAPKPLPKSSFHRDTDAVLEQLKKNLAYCAK